jgi:hypothetical protein
MTIASKSTDSQNHALSLSELDQVNGGNVRDAIAVAIAVGLGPMAGLGFLSYYTIAKAANAYFN